MTDIFNKIMIELLSVFAVATKQIKQGRFSECAYYVNIVRGSICHREIREKVVGREQDSRGAPKIGSIDRGRGSDDCRTVLECGPWPCGEYEGSDGRCAMPARSSVD
jgi:hypothetical protein